MRVAKIDISWKWIAWGAAGVLAVAGVLALTFLSPGGKERLVEVLEWVRDRGVLGAVILIVLYAVAAIFFLPGSVLTLSAGFMYGVIWGSVVASLGNVVGATAAFLFVRTFGRRFVERKISGSDKFENVDRALQNHGLRVVILLRMSPVFPFALLNYLFGLTGVRIGPHAFGTLVGMLPGTIMFVYIGSGLWSLAQAAAGEAAKESVGRVGYWVGLAAAIVITMVATWIAGRTLKNAMEEGEAAFHDD